jgi:ABC-2 type transport system permease protein
MDDFGKGIVDTRQLVYYLSATVLFLFLAARSLEAKKWR